MDRTKMREVLASLSPDEIFSVYNALAQWADNERDNDETDDPGPYLEDVQNVVERLELAYVKETHTEV